MERKRLIPLLFLGALLLGGMIFLVLPDRRSDEVTDLVEKPDENLPQIGFGKTLEKTFVLTNDSDDPLFIKQIVTSCPCTTIKNQGLGALPGESVSFTAVFRAEALGKNEIDIDVRLAGQETSEFFKFDVLVTPPSSFVRFTENEAQRESENEYTVSAVEALTQIGGEKGTQLFDFRPVAMALQGAIPGAIKLSLGELDAYPSSGLDAIFVSGITLQAELREKIDALAAKPNGFNSVRMLDGGLRAWRLAGGALTGSDQDAVDLYSLTSDEVKMIVGRGDWEIVLLGAARKRHGLDLLFSSQVHVRGKFADLDSLEPELMARLDAAYKSGKKLLFISDRGEGYQWIEGLMQGASPASVHYLRGGIASYFKAMAEVDYRPSEERKLISLVEYTGQREPAARRRTRGCPSCPK